MQRIAEHDSLKLKKQEELMISCEQSNRSLTSNAERKKRQALACAENAHADCRGLQSMTT